MDANTTPYYLSRTIEAIEHRHEATRPTYLLRKTIEGLESIRDALRADLETMGFYNTVGRAYRVRELARVVNKLRDLRGE